MTFELYPRITWRGRRWFWRLKAENGEIVASGQGYSRRLDAERAIELVRSSEIAALKVWP